jgi:hypothetical protein
MITDADRTQPGITQVLGDHRQGGQGRGEPPQSATQDNPATRTADAPAPSGPPVTAPASPGNPGPDHGYVTQAASATGAATSLSVS